MRPSTKDVILKLIDQIHVNPSQTALIDLAATLQEKGIDAEILPEVWESIALKSI